MPSVVEQLREAAARKKVEKAAASASAAPTASDISRYQTGRFGEVQTGPGGEQAEREAKAGASGLRSGTEGIGGMAGDLPDLAGRIGRWVSGKTGLGDPEAVGGRVQGAAETVISPGVKLIRALQMAGIIDADTAEKIIAVQAPGSQDVGAATDWAVKQLPESVSGPIQDITRFQPATFGERAAFQTGAFLPALATGGTGEAGTLMQGVRSFGTRVLAPALASETAGTVAHEYLPEYEPAIRIVTAAVTGVLPNTVENALNVRQAAKDIGRSPAALTRVKTELERSGMTPEQALQTVDDLGKGTTLMDVNANLLQEGQRIVAKGGGAGRTTITGRLGERQLGTAERVEKGIHEELGPPTSPTEYEVGIKKELSDLSPEYKAALQAPGVKPVDAQAIDTVMQNAISKTVGDTEAALEKVAGFIRDKKTGALTSDPERALAARHEIDQIMKSQTTGSNTRHYLQEVRNAIDDQLKVAVPGIKDVDLKYGTVAQKGTAFEEGQKSLQKGSKWPRDIEKEIATKGPHIAEGMREGVRAEIEDIVGNTGYNAMGLKKAIKGDGSYNRQKLEILFGKEKADAVAKILDRELTWQRTHVRATEQSPTAERGPEIPAQDKADLLRDVGVGFAVNQLPGAAAALVTNIGRSAFDKLRRQRAIARDAEVADLISSDEPTRVLRGVQLAQQRGAVLPQTMVNALLARQYAKEQ